MQENNLSLWEKALLGVKQQGGCLAGSLRLGHPSKVFVIFRKQREKAIAHITDKVISFLWLKQPDLDILNKNAARCKAKGLLLPKIEGLGT